MEITRAWLGDKDFAFEQLAIAIRRPSNLRPVEVASVLRSATRRPALRANRGLPRAQGDGEINSNESEEILRRTEAAQRLQSCGGICGRGVAVDSGGHAGLPTL
jgi:hypothetical protein